MNAQIEKILGPLSKLSKEQKKIIYISLTGLGFLLAFWIFVYAPQSKEFTRIKGALTQTENQIAEIARLTAGRDLTEAVRDLRSQMLAAADKLPAQDEVVIHNILDSAKGLKIEVDNVSPADKRPIDGGIFGYEVQELPIVMSLSCEYRVLGEYLDVLRNKSPVLIRLRQLNIETKGEGRPDLDINLQLSAYLAREKK